MLYLQVSQARNLDEKEIKSIIPRASPQLDLGTTALLKDADLIAL